MLADVPSANFASRNSERSGLVDSMEILTFNANPLNVGVINLEIAIMAVDEEAWMRNMQLG